MILPEPGPHFLLFPGNGVTNTADVSAPQFAKGRLGSLFRVSPQQLCIVRHHLFTYQNLPITKSDSIFRTLT